MKEAENNKTAKLQWTILFSFVVNHHKWKNSPPWEHPEQLVGFSEASDLPVSSFLSGILMSRNIYFLILKFICIYVLSTLFSVFVLVYVCMLHLFYYFIFLIYIFCSQNPKNIPQLCSANQKTDKSHFHSQHQNTFLKPNTESKPPMGYSQTENYYTCQTSSQYWDQPFHTRIQCSL